MSDMEKEKSDRDNDGVDSVERLQLHKTPLDETETQHQVELLMLPDVIKKRMQMILDAMHTRIIRTKAEITIQKIGVVPEARPDGNEIPSDIPKGALFVFGEAWLPVPICTERDENPDGFTWRLLLRTSFSFYRPTRSSRPHIIISPYVYEQSSAFLNSIKQRVADRRQALMQLRTGPYASAIADEIFYPLKDLLEPLYLQWISDTVQEIIDARELKGIVETVENERTLFSLSDLSVDTTEAMMDEKLYRKLRERSPVIPSCQNYVGRDAQTGWLNLCKMPSYNLAAREMDFLAQHADQIVAEIDEADNILIFGLGNFEKELLLLEKLLEKKGDRKTTVHGIDVGPEFHLRAFKGMKAIQQTKTQELVRYRGHLALFENASEINEHIRKRSKSGARTLRVSLGNTFGNFENPWDVYTQGMEKGDILLITSDTLPSPQDLSREDRRARIKDIVARYKIPEWREWVLNPLYRVGFRGRVFADKVKVEWDEKNNRVVFTYPGPIDNGSGIEFGLTESIELYRSGKIDCAGFALEAKRNGFTIRKRLKNEEDDFGCVILEKL